jgi:hypothetical protein
MAIETKIIEAGGYVSTAPARLAAVEGTMSNRGNTFAETDYDPSEQPFVAGHCTSDTGATVFFDYS